MAVTTIDCTARGYTRIPINIALAAVFDDSTINVDGTIVIADYFINVLMTTVIPSARSRDGSHGIPPAPPHPASSPG